MAQTYKMKHNPQGTIYSLLTVESDGQMTMTFHGTDRELSQEATLTEDGRIAVGGSLFPGLESGKWQAVAPQMRNEKLEMRNENEEMRNEVAESETTTDDTDCTDNHAEPEVIEENTNCTNYTNNEPLTINHAPLTLNHDCRPRRQRKPRKPRVEHQPSSIDHQPSDIDRHQTSSTLKAIGMVAAATVALFVIYETGLLIPLGLIGLATGGILK
jgi:hypothetical protein